MSDSPRIRSDEKHYLPLQEERRSRAGLLWATGIVASLLLHLGLFGAGQLATSSKLTRALSVEGFDASFADPPEPPPKEEAKKEPEPEPLPPEPIAAKDPAPEPEPEPEPAPPTDTGPDLGAVEGGTGPAMASGNGRGDAPPPPVAAKPAPAAPKPAAKPRRGPVRLDQAGTPPRALKQDPKMGYPRAFREKAISGLVVIQCIITEQGKVRACRAKDGPAELSEYAISIIRDWEYEPAKDHAGKPIAVAFTWRFPFRLA